MSAVAPTRLAAGCLVWSLGRVRNSPIFFFSVPKNCFLFSMAVSFLSIKTSFTLSNFSLAIKVASSTKEGMPLILCSSVLWYYDNNSVRSFLLKAIFFYFWFCTTRRQVNNTRCFTSTDTSAVIVFSIIWYVWDVLIHIITQVSRWKSQGKECRTGILGMKDLMWPKNYGFVKSNKNSVQSKLL